MYANCPQEVEVPGSRSTSTARIPYPPKRLATVITHGPTADHQDVGREGLGHRNVCASSRKRSGVEP